jgi:hypothetical protein
MKSKKMKILGKKKKAEEDVGDAFRNNSIIVWYSDFQ